MERDRLVIEAPDLCGDLIELDDGRCGDRVIGGWSKVSRKQLALERSLPKCVQDDDEAAERRPSSDGWRRCCSRQALRLCIRVGRADDDGSRCDEAEADDETEDEQCRARAYALKRDSEAEHGY